MILSTSALRYRCFPPTRTGTCGRGGDIHSIQEIVDLWKCGVCYCMLFPISGQELVRVQIVPSRKYTTFPTLIGLSHSSRSKYRYNESLLEITNLTVTIQKLAQHIIKLINITTFAYYMIC